MDQQAFQAGRAAYMNGDFATAQAMLQAAKAPGEISGAADHMRGNALMKMGLYQEAADAYAAALKDNAYGKVGAIATNRGRALLAAGSYAMAEASLEQALQDPTYTNQYKAQMALGTIYEHEGDLRGAGAAYRAAAIDENNPDPSAALQALGRCFMELGRPVDAVEAYRTALDFAKPQSSQNAIYAALGEAFVAASRMPEALDAFGRATADGAYTLTPKQQAAYTAAQNAAAALAAKQQASGTDAFLAAAGYGNQHVDPLDPLGKSGEFIPSPEDTGFFEISERDIIDADKKKTSKKRKKRHTGLKVFLVFVVLILIIGGAGAYAYYKGYGWPTQETVVSDLFYAKTDNTDMGSYIAGSVSADQRKAIEAILPSGAQVTINGVDRSMNDSKVSLTATLAQGGTQDYIVSLVRDGISWKITNVELSFDSVVANTDSSADAAAPEGEATGDGSATGDATADAGADQAVDGTVTQEGTVEGEAAAA